MAGKVLYPATINRFIIGLKKSIGSIGERFIVRMNKKDVSTMWYSSVIIL